jgi:enolase
MSRKDLRMGASKIKQIKARQVLDENGRPVPEVDIITEDGYLGRAGASTGTSVGKNESYVMRDGNPNLFGGLSVYKAIENIEKIIAPALIGIDIHDQGKIDRTMIELDGTRYKTRLGGNAIYATSVAAVKAAAASNGKPLFLNMAGEKKIEYIFTPASNVVNGGTYNDKSLAFQEFMIIPHGVTTGYEAIRIIVEVFQRLGQIIKQINGRSANMGNYSGYGAPSDDPFEVFEMMATAVAESGYKNNVMYAIDCASSEFYDEQAGGYNYRGEIVSRDKIIDILARLTEKYPIIFIEDALQEEDFEGFKLASQRIQSIIIGDDFLCTSIDRARKAVEMNAAQGMVFKPNQAGTITEALETARYMIEQGMLVVPSGRAGGVLDSPEKEIGLALGCPLTKTGAPRSASRTSGMNFLMRTSEELSIPIANAMNLKRR